MTKGLNMRFRIFFLIFFTASVSQTAYAYLESGSDEFGVQIIVLAVLIVSIYTIIKHRRQIKAWLSGKKDSPDSKNTEDSDAL